MAIAYLINNRKITAKQYARITSLYKVAAETELDAFALDRKTPIRAIIEGKNKIYVMDNTILSLPTKQQLTFNMRYYDELEYDDIAHIIGSTPSSVKASYHIAKEKIIKYMNI